MKFTDLLQYYLIQIHPNPTSLEGFAEWLDNNLTISATTKQEHKITPKESHGIPTLPIPEILTKFGPQNK